MLTCLSLCPVAFDTTFEQIEKLRESMLEFIEANRRDFNPSFDITVEDLPEQGRLSLEVPIMYRSNWQNVSLKWQRRNKWVCALKLALAAHSICESISCTKMGQLLKGGLKLALMALAILSLKILDQHLVRPSAMRHLLTSF